MRKDLFVFAGANGSGKSTIVNFYRRNNLCPQLYICPDQLVPHDKKNDVQEYISAMQEAEKRRIENVTLENSFTFETVLSTEEKLNFLLFSKSEGYFVTVIYVTTYSPEINLARIRKRVEQGAMMFREKKF